MGEETTMPKNIDKDKIIRKMTYHLYKDQVHEQSQVRGIYKYNQVTFEESGLDPFKLCKTMADVRAVFLKAEKKELSSIFKEGADFVLVKIDKRKLSYFQQILPHELNNSVKFIKEE